MEQVTDWIPGTKAPRRHGWYDVLFHDTGEIRRVPFHGLIYGLWAVERHVVVGVDIGGEPLTEDTSYIIHPHKTSWRGLARKPRAG